MDKHHPNKSTKLDIFEQPSLTVLVFYFYTYVCIYMLIFIFCFFLWTDNILKDMTNAIKKASGTLFLSTKTTSNA